MTTGESKEEIGKIWKEKLTYNRKAFQRIKNNEE
jgi:hypothetical protein